MNVSNLELLNYHAQVFKECQAMSESADAQTCHLFTDLGVHIYNGIQRLAEDIGQPLSFVPFDDVERPLLATFVYKEVPFFQIGTKEDFQTKKPTSTANADEPTDG